jgi:hypothetical protein
LEDRDLLALRSVCRAWRAAPALAVRGRLELQLCWDFEGCAPCAGLHSPQPPTRDGHRSQLP